MKKLILAVSLLVSVTAAQAQPHAIFSCFTAKGKAVEVSEIKAPTVTEDGQWRYDYGRPGNIELTLFTNAGPAPQGGENIIEFTNGNLTYQVNGNGVDVFKQDGGILTSVTCVASTIRDHL